MTRYYLIFSLMLLLFFGCNMGKNQETIVFKGEEDYWNVIFEVIYFENKSQQNATYLINMNYLKETVNNDNPNTLYYEIDWSHKDAILGDTSNETIFFGSSKSPVRSRIRIEEKLAFISFAEDITSKGKISAIDINEMSDIISLLIKWNNNMEIIKLQRRQL